MFRSDEKDYFDHCSNSTSVRIISVVPSFTELLYDLGLDEEVVGITKFCVHPAAWFRKKQRVGGTKELKIDLIKQLKPDLIIANKEENTKEDIEACRQFCEVYLYDVSNFDEALLMIRAVGRITNRSAAAEQIIVEITKAFAQLKHPAASMHRSVYLIWKDPIMSVGGDTFISDMMAHAGFENLMAGEKRYPVLQEAQLSTLQPEVLMLSSEPFPFDDRHLPYFRKLLPQSKILFVDGEMFSWYGSRMRRAPAYFDTLKTGR